MNRLVQTTLLTIVGFLSTISCVDAQETVYLNPSASIESRVNDLLPRLTLEEKIGQMTQINITLINTTGVQKDVVLDENKLRDIIKKYHVGSFLNGEAVSPQTWFTYMNALMKVSLEESRLKIPIIYGIDHMHGASYVDKSTLFPQNITLGASFNKEFARQAGRITVNESADLGHHWVFAPVLDVARTPLWPRFYETFGEDPYAAGVLGAEFIKGIQNNDEIAPYKIAASGKHFLGYSDPRTGWDRTPVDLSMQTIHEIYRPSFQMAIDAGLKTLMVNSGEINGVPVHASPVILTDLLRNQMKFDGVIVTDWADINKLVDYHKVAHNLKEATYLSVKAGIDMSMTPDHFGFNDVLLELVKEGKISEARIDSSVRRILTLKFELGLFEHPLPRNDRFARVGSDENKAIALEAARESIVLLKNENNVLPLTSPKKLVLVGKSIRDKKNWHGGWTYAWQGAANEQLAHTASFEESIKKEFPNSSIVVFDDINPKNAKQFEKEAKSADAIVVAVGEEPYTEFVGNITDLNLPANQKTWISTAIDSKKPVILVLVEGRPRLFSEFNKDLRSVIFAGLPSTFGPQAVAEILSGKTNPSGKLSFSYPAYINHQQPYNHKSGAVYFFDPNQANFIQQEVKSTNLYSFGDGLSFSKFEYSDLSFSSKKVGKSENVTVSVKVTNTGKRTGKEAVLWFITDEVGSITRPVKELKYFEKIELKAGESKVVSFVINPMKSLSFPNEKGERLLENGTFTVRVGSLKDAFELN